MNSLQNDKIFDWSKFKGFADDKLNVTKMIISVFDRVENIVGKEEISCTSNFSFSHNAFKRLLFQTHQKVSLCGNGLRALPDAKDNVTKKWKFAVLPFPRCKFRLFQLRRFWS